ncbi:MAG: hypothetical protein HKM93_19645 [Desulfobacteraceae bacterium]|nr:hypothetical protein [Desulfobacteraceae bacterium]
MKYTIIPGLLLCVLQLGCQNTQMILDTTTEQSSLTRSGIIKQDETWKGIVNVTGTTIVPENVTLTIEPGTIVNFKHGSSYEAYLIKNKKASLHVAHGKLKAIGTAEKPIWFTSDRKNPINEDWGGISFVYSTGNELRYVIVEYADIGIELELNSSVAISNSILRWSQTGIYQEVHCSAVVKKNRFYGLGHEAFAMEEYCSAIVENNKITACNSAIVVVDGKAEVRHNLVSHNFGKGMEIIGAWGDSEVVFAGNKITRNYGQHTVMIGKGARATFTSNEISHNQEGGILCLEADEFVFTNNAVYDNRNGIDIAEAGSFYITHNWWGTTDRKEIAKRIGYNKELNFEPFLDESPTEFVVPIFDYNDIRKMELDYLPGDPDDRYIRVFPEEDETRRIVKRIGEEFGYEGVGWSLCWDGEFLWTFRHDSANLCKVDSDTGKVLKQFKIPGINRSRGIAFDGKHLWVNDFAGMKIFEIDPEDGKIISTFKVPDEIEIVQTVVWDGSYLHLSGYGEPRLYKVDKKGNVLGLTKLEKGGAATITWDGNHWWSAADDGAIYKLNESGKVVGMINGAAEEPWSLMWDGAYLWTIERLHERWENVPRMFKIEVLDDQSALKKWKEDQSMNSGH